MTKMTEYKAVVIITAQRDFLMGEEVAPIESKELIQAMEVVIAEYIKRNPIKTKKTMPELDEIDLYFKNFSSLPNKF
jgi:hypothetical protein